MPSDAPKPYHHKDLRRALVEQAALALAAGGTQAVSLRDLAREIGVSHSAPLRHFPNREALLAELAIHGFRQLTEAMEVAVAARGPVSRVEALQGAGIAYVLFAADQPHLFRLMFTADRVEADRYPALKDAGEACKSSLMAWVTRAFDSGEMVGPSAEIVGLACWATVHGMAALAIDGQLEIHDSVQLRGATQALLDCLGSGIARVAGDPA